MSETFCLIFTSQDILKSGWEQMSVVYMVTNQLVSEILSQKGESDNLREAQIKGYAGNFMRDSGIQEWVNQQGGMVRSVLLNFTEYI